MARQWAIRQAWLFQASNYPDKNFAAEPDDPDRSIAGTRAAQEWLRWGRTRWLEPLPCLLVC